MTFVACDNNDNEMGQLDNTPKSVSINPVSYTHLTLPTKA